MGKLALLGLSSGKFCVETESSMHSDAQDGHVQGPKIT